MLAAAIAMVVSGQAQASAGVLWEADQWGPVCASPYGACESGARGGIVWGQRTAEVSGSVWDDGADPGTYAKVYFDAFAGSVKVDSESRTTNGEERSFRFPIGDPDRVGGIDRIRIQVCAHFPEWPYQECSSQYNEIRD